MSATATSIHEFIGNLRIHAPRDFHPMSRTIIDQQLAEMREADPATVTRLMSSISFRIARDLRWEAETRSSLGQHKDAWKLLRRADRFDHD